MSTIKKIFSITLIVLLVVGSVAVSSMNAGSVVLDLYWYQWTMPLGFMLLLFAAIGLLFGLVLCWLLWLWPAQKQKRYWERAYFQLKQAQETPDSNSENQSKSMVKIP